MNIFLGKSADGKEREDFDINTAPAWAWADLDGWTGTYTFFCTMMRSHKQSLDSLRRICCFIDYVEVR